MTTACDTAEKARNLELGEEMFDLLNQIEDLRDQLAEVRCLTPWDQVR